MDNIIQFHMLDEHTTTIVNMNRFGPMRNLWASGQNSHFPNIWFSGNFAGSFARCP